MRYVSSNYPQIGLIQLLDGVYPVAEVHYRILDNEVLPIDHTFVDPEYRNEGIGSKIIFELVSYALSNGFHVYPICPFAKHLLKERI
jgi:predicted GNAT family acetyltransferase